MSNNFVPPHRRVGAVPQPQSGATAIPGKNSLAQEKPPTLPCLATKPHPHLSEERSASSDTMTPAKEAVVPSSSKRPSVLSNAVQQSESAPSASEKGFPTATPLPYRKSDKWIKDSDLKSGRWMEQQMKDAAAAGTLSGWEEASNSNAAKDEGYSIYNYDGTWAPAPENWDARPAFRDHQSSEAIQAWLDATAAPSNPLEWITKYARYTNFYQIIEEQRRLGESGRTTRYHFCSAAGEASMGAIVPLYWRPEPAEGYTSLGQFWNAYLAMQPPPYDENDLKGMQPWWELCPSPMACFQYLLQQPDHEGFCPEDEDDEQRNKRAADNGSEGAVKRWQRGIRPPKGRQARGPRELMLSAPPRSTPKVDLVEDIPITTQQEIVVYEDVYDPSIHPKIRFYIRPAQISDLPAVTRIYNHYATNTLRVPECSSILPNHMHDRLRAIESVSHTFKVACLPSGTSNRVNKGSRNVNRGRKTSSGDTVIGFAYSDDFNDPLGMYRFVAEVEVYTDPQHTRKGVATCLMDDLLSILDPYFIPRRGYECRSLELAKPASRLLSCLWINFAYVPEENDKEWASKWLESMGFEQTGDHKKVGFKIGKSANLAVFTRPTGYEVDPLDPPIDMAI